MLERLSIRNFKSWRTAELDFGRITGLFGTNSSGKSSLGQFLLLLKQTRESTDRMATLDLNGRFVELGTAADVVHAHDEDRVIDFELGFEHETDLRIDDPWDRGRTRIADSRSLTIRAEVEVSQQAFQCRKLTYAVGEAEFAVEPKAGDSTRFDLIATIPHSEFGFTRTQGRAWPLRRPAKAYRFPDRVRAYFQDAGFLADLEAAFERQFDRLYYLGPLREHPRRDYLWARSRPADVGEKGERTIDAIIAAQDSGEVQNLVKHGRRKPFPEIIAHWLRELDLIDQFRIVEIAPGSSRWQAKVQTHAGASEVMLTDVGFGVSQVLPVITLLHYVPEGSTVLLEQPEIHLHPLAQAGLADVIVNVAVHRNVQIVLESHSEHLLLRLQRRVAEERIDADDVTLYFCDARDGMSGIERLDLDMFGKIRNWPDKFMGDAFGETAKAELARLERMKQAAE